MTKREKIKLISNVIKVLNKSKTTYYDDTFYVCRIVSNVLKKELFDEFKEFISKVSFESGGYNVWLMYGIIYYRNEFNDKINYILSAKKTKVLILKQFKEDIKNNSLDINKYTFDYLLEITKSIRK